MRDVRRCTPKRAHAKLATLADLTLERAVVDRS
jgi:hypothetical protein